MRATGLLIATGLCAAGPAAARAQAFFNGIPQPVGAQFSQVGYGPQRDGATAAGAKVALLGTGVGVPSITCPFTGATWRISGGGIFSTAATPGNVTPEISFGSMATSYVITNVLATASNARWGGFVKIVCGTIGTSGTMYVPEGNVNYATGALADGSAPLNQATALTGDNTGPMAIGVNVTMAGTSASNKFRLDGFTIERLY